MTNELQNEVTVLSAENAFTLTIATPLLKLAAQGFNEPIIILVDSLDESLLYTGTPKIVTLLQRLGSLPDNLRLICTTRPQTSITEPLVGQMCRLELNAPEFHDDINADIVAYAERALSQYPQLTTNIPRSQLIERIQELADGNFLYLSQLLPLMTQIEDMDVSDLNEIEPGLDPLYRSYLSDFQANWQTVGAIFGTLAVARAPLTVRQLQDITGQTGARSVLATVRPLLETDDEIPASQRTYTLYHRSFADFLLDEDDAELYWCDPVEQHQRIADCYTNEFAGYWDDADDYGLRYVVTHLGLATVAQRNPTAGTRQLLDLLQTGSFVTVHRARFDDFAGLQTDFQLALQCAVKGRRPEMLPLVVQASCGYLRFRQSALDPATIFTFAQAGNGAAALRRLSLFSADVHWLAVTWLLIAWLVYEHNPVEAQELLNQMANANESYIWPFDQLRELVTSQIAPNQPVPHSELPDPPPPAMIDAILARFDSEIDPEGIGNFALGSAQYEMLGAADDGSRAMLTEAIHVINQTGNTMNPDDPLDVMPMYLAQQDGIWLVAYAAENPEQGDSFVEQYLAISGANQYAFYRNRSLWILLEALLRHPDPNWMQRMCVTTTQYALSGTAAAFEGAAQEARWALMKRSEPVGAEAYAQHVESVLQHIYDKDGNRTRDMWGNHKRTMLSLAEALLLLPDSEQMIKQLLKRARKTKGYAGFQATARLCEAETAYIIAGEVGVSVWNALDRARSSAHNIQDPVFCARSTARETALRELWWRSLDNIDEEIKSFISEPDQPKYLARHRIGERYDLRHDTADKIPLPGGMRYARTLSDLAAVYESSPEELARLNNLDAYELLDDGMLIAVPDTTFRYWLARRFSAELLVNPQDQPYRQRATLMRQLVPIVADDASALDTLLARLLLLTAVEPLSAGIVNELSAALTADSAPSLRHVPALFPGEANESR